MSEYHFITTKQELLNRLALSKKNNDTTGIWLRECDLKEMPKNTVRFLIGDNGWESEPEYDYFNAEQCRNLATYLNQIADALDKDKAAGDG